MISIKKLAAAGLAAATLAITVMPAEAQWRRGGHGWRGAPAYGGGFRHHRGGWNRGGAVAAGVLGGALLGAALAPRAYGYYGAPAYSAPAYAAPVYGAPSYGECYKEHVGYTRSGRPLYQTVCQ